MQIRPFQPADFETLYALEELCFTPPLRFDREFMLKILTHPASINRVVLDAQTVIAFIIGSVHQKNSLRTVYIETLEVHPAFRRQGLASRMLAEFEASARASSADQIRLHVDAANTAAIRLYERHGFVRHRLIENFYPTGASAFIYRKNLE